MNLSICRPCNYSKAYSVHVTLNNTTNISKELFPSSPVLNTIEKFRKQQNHYVSEANCFQNVVIVLCVVDDGKNTC